MASGLRPSRVLVCAALTGGALPSRSGGFGLLSPQTGERCDWREVGQLPCSGGTVFSIGASQANGADVQRLFARQRSQHARASIRRLPHRFSSSPASNRSLPLHQDCS